MATLEENKQALTDCYEQRRDCLLVLKTDERVRLRGNTICVIGKMKVTGDTSGGTPREIALHTIDHVEVIYT